MWLLDKWDRRQDAMTTSHGAVIGGETGRERLILLATTPSIGAV